jgi:formylglycine-generating enzyme required for sulfatase activity
VGPTHPAASIDGVQVDRAFLAWGLRLPTSAEWDHLARGYTTTPWWCGEDWRQLQERENVADRSLLASGSADDPYTVDWDDHFAGSAAVGSLQANPFGLHDVLGNVAEVCADEPEGTTPHRVRGGSWHQGYPGARVAAGFSWGGSGVPSIGVRPVLSLEE